MPLQIIRQDITKMKVDAIVNTTNKKMIGTTKERLPPESAKAQKFSTNPQIINDLTIRLIFLNVTTQIPYIADVQIIDANIFAFPINSFPSRSDDSGFIFPVNINVIIKTIADTKYAPHTISNIFCSLIKKIQKNEIKNDTIIRQNAPESKLFSSEYSIESADIVINKRYQIVQTFIKVSAFLFI